MHPKKFFHFVFTLLTTALLGAHDLAYAESADPINWRMFGHIGVAGSNLDEVSSTTGEPVAYTPRVTESFDFRDYTLFGLNGSRVISDQWTGIFQVVGKTNSDNFQFYADWALVQYQATSSLSFTAGRQPYQLWLVSDHANVGILYPWIDPPQEIYSLLPVRSYDGVSLRYQLVNSDFDLFFDVFGGSSELGNETISAGTINGDINDVLGGAIVFENDEITLRLGYGTAVVDGEVVTEFDLPTTINSVTYNIRYRNVTDYDLGRANFYSAGFRYQSDTWVLWSEFAHLETENDIFGRVSGYYATLGRYFGSLFPHYTYAYTDVDVATVAPGSSLSHALGLNYEINNGLTFKIDGKYVEPSSDDRITQLSDTSQEDSPCTGRR